MAKTPKTLGFGTDDDDQGGARLVPGNWQPPERVSEADAEAARTWLKNHQAATDERNFRPAPDGVVSKWLGTVISVSARSRDMSQEDVLMKVAALKLMVDDRDVRWFTKETIREAVRTFDKWIPSGSELMDFFDTLEANERMMAQRMLTVSDIAARGPKPKPKREPGEYYNPTQEPGWTWSREEAEAYTLKMRELKRAELAELAKIAREQPHAQNDHEVPQRGPGESDELFMARLKQHRHAVLDTATKVMKSFGAGRKRLKPEGPVQVATAINRPLRPDIAERARREAARHDDQADAEDQVVLEVLGVGT
jgi:hypothetical protein